jgi:hypothetical protein
MKRLFAGCALLLLAACGSSSDKPADSLIAKGMEILDSAKNTTPDFTLDDYNGFPPEIEGCTCYFSENKEKFGKQQFLFTSNADGLGVVAINNKQVKLKQVSIVRDKDPGSNNENISVYEAEGYKVTVRITGKTRSGDEVWTNTGTITVEKDGKKIEKAFTGECGC